MRQHQDPDDLHHEDLDRHDDEEDLEEFGTPVYQGTGLSVRALTAEELQRFLDAHADQPAQLLGSGWAALDQPGHSLGVPRTPPAAAAAAMPAEVTGAHGSPGRSALVEYRRRRALELAGWTRGLAWRVPLVAEFDGLRIHDLRHTAVALWIAAGASPKEVARRAGHTSVKTVLDVYGHLYDEADVALRERLEAMFVPFIALPTDSCGPGEHTAPSEAPSPPEEIRPDLWRTESGSGRT